MDVSRGQRPSVLGAGDVGEVAGGIGPHSPRRKNVVHMRGVTSTRRVAFPGMSPRGFTSSSCRRTEQISSTCGRSSNMRGLPVGSCTSRAAIRTIRSGGSMLQLPRSGISCPAWGLGIQGSAVCWKPVLGKSNNEDEDIVHASWRHGEPREQGSRSGSCGWITSFLGSTLRVPRS